MTRVVNFFAGPGAGKSRLAIATTNELNNLGFKVELVTEFAKDLVWSDREKCIKCAPYVLGEQYYRVSRLINKVDFIVTDCPILLAAAYANTFPASFSYAIIDLFRQFDNVNFFVQRNIKNYDNNGRNQTLKKAKQIDIEVKFILGLVLGDFNNYSIDKIGAKISKDYCNISMVDYEKDPRYILDIIIREINK